ncbi:Spermatogenesis-associated protein 17 [Chelonia mydas]|uniref:Spermatogenesis-associated protein 17 n=1 Tax=Chelonia mydas TaxID=8469 RepID=M7BGF4_CHEMY|nr:Spermatogenesis-associated protein 17 [Chelonia mydas]
MKEKEKEKKDLEREEKKKDHQARKMHYLLSTEQLQLPTYRNTPTVRIQIVLLKCKAKVTVMQFEGSDLINLKTGNAPIAPVLWMAGVYNSPFRQSPDPMEVRLRKARPFSHRQQQIKKHLTDDISDWLTCTSTHWQTETSVPWNVHCEGPFRDTAEVLQQRYKPLEPTLRVATSINSLEKAREEIKREEWRNRINDNKFLPFSSCHKKQEYDPLIHTSSKYGQMTYGIKHFREEHHEKWVANKIVTYIYLPYSVIVVGTTVPLVFLFFLKKVIHKDASRQFQKLMKWIADMLQIPLEEVREVHHKLQDIFHTWISIKIAILVNEAFMEPTKMDVTALIDYTDSFQRDVTAYFQCSRSEEYLIKIATDDDTPPWNFTAAAATVSYPPAPEATDSHSSSLPASAVCHPFRYQYAAHMAVLQEPHKSSTSLTTQDAAQRCNELGTTPFTSSCELQVEIGPRLLDLVPSQPSEHSQKEWSPGSSSVNSGWFCFIIKLLKERKRNKKHSPVAVWPDPVTINISLPSTGHNQDCSNAWHGTYTAKQLTEVQECKPFSHDSYALVTNHVSSSYFCHSCPKIMNISIAKFKMSHSGFELFYKHIQ